MCVLRVERVVRVLRRSLRSVNNYAYGPYLDDM